MNALARVLERVPEPKRRGQAWRARCPVHQGRSTSSLSLAEGCDGRVLVRCFAGCELAAIVESLGLELRDLFEDRQGLPSRRRTPPPIVPPATPQPPSDPWQARALEIIEASERRLWEPMGERALAYLRRRGFIDATIRQARLGYHPCEVRDAPERWAFPPDRKSVWMPRGIVIPVLQGETVWMLWIRRLVGEPKYLAVAGSKHHDVGMEAVRFGHPAMLAEGIFDRLAVHQEAGDLVTSIAVGTRHGTLCTIARLALATPVLLSLDADDAGAAAAIWWHRIFPQARRWCPIRKDPAEILEMGGNVRAWVAAGILDTTMTGHYLCMKR
jgi:hypothetical protein